MIRDPFLDRLHRTFTEMNRFPKEQSGPQAFVALENAVGAAKVGRGADGFVAEAFYGLNLLERRIVESVTDEAMLRVYGNTLSRIHLALVYSSLQKPLQNYRRDHLSPELIDAIIMLDRAVTVRPISSDTLEGWLKQVDHLRAKVRSSNELPVHLSSLLVAQCDLIERAATRYTLDGAVGFRDQVYCSLGVLELRLKENEDWGTIEIAKETMDWMLRVAGTVELTQAALDAIPFFSGIAGLLTGPK